MPIVSRAQDVYCPSCGTAMSLRKGRYGSFYGCSSYPKCKKIVNLDDAPLYASPPVQKAFTPSSYQEDIREFALHGNGHGIVKARAGSGKTTTNVWIGNEMRDFLGVAFNTHIQRAWAAKARTGVIKTWHSFGLWAIRRELGRVEVDSDGAKLRAMIWPAIDAQRHLEYDDKRALFGTTRQLISLAKNTLNDDFDQLSNRYGIALNGDQDLVYTLAGMALEQSKQQTSVVDFDDMIWLPNVLNLQTPQFEFILGDEVQDWNMAQIGLAKRALAPGGRFLGVGDDMQSLYGFRGADAEAVPRLVQEFNAEVLSLPISYRCPKQVVALAQLLVPDIQAAPWAEDGEIRYYTSDDFLASVGAGDMILCRTNAPLVAPIYALIQMGIKATIRGRDIGEGLVVFIEKYAKKAATFNEMLMRMCAYRDREVAKALAQDKGSLAQSVNDKVETILALSVDVDTVEQLIDKTRTIFDSATPTVVGSTVHRAKGLEADNVFIIRPELMPHPMAKQAWEIQQEANCQYVAWTRAKKTLTFVTD